MCDTLPHKKKIVLKCSWFVSGLDRPKFAADCLGVLLKELRLHCQDAVDQGLPDHCKVAVIIRGIGRLFDERTLIPRTMPAKYPRGPFTEAFVKESIAPDELSVVRSIKKMLK